MANEIDISPDTLTVTFDFSKPQPFGYYVRQISEIVEEIERRAYARGYVVGLKDGTAEGKGFSGLIETQRMPLEALEE